MAAIMFLSYKTLIRLATVAYVSAVACGTSSAEPGAKEISAFPPRRKFSIVRGVMTLARL